MNNKVKTLKSLCNQAQAGFSVNDFICGVYRNGKFVPYGFTDSMDALFDKGSNPKALERAESGMAVHGSYKNGNFRPAEVEGRRGYVGRCLFRSKELGIDYRGRLYENGIFIGLMLDSGKVQFIERH